MSPYYRGHLAMLLFSALVAGSFSLGSMVANDIAPMALNAIRFVIAGVVIGVAAHLTHGLKPAHFRAPWRFAVLGGLFAVYFVLMFYGLQTAPPVSAAAVFTLTPVLSAVFGFLLLRQITTLPMALALAIGGAGAIWVIFRGDLSAMRAFEVGQGEITYFWGCVAHAIYTPMVRRLNRGEPAVVFTFGTLVAGAIILTLFGWQDIRATDWASLSSLVWIAILYVAVFASAATFVLLQYASLHLPSAKVMAYTYLTPSWVILWEIALGKGVPDVIVLLGIALSVLALVMLLEGRARTSKA
ncbi:DMT family transporter [Phaeobacter italicus]|jgi:drug/metabolite transporter (DMT)-like permease|uniref:DMT family transporter n=1 Tax=Phaeobacter italicus TaxID=481446 RepID=UPI000669E2EA|nr:DMT family transporter [Phaeobacter italicus]MBY6044242.1 DMT family transporter [Phaeobacter italicus]MEE2818080.1 DMT family transporter [Pseudomonadota bacterium]CRL14874.1 carboxylate/amino acid/amine transporter [Phaeobacter italicus]SFH07309.1 EamA-like transporter family protein [Phaeobacter italicus]